MERKMFLEKLFEAVGRDGVKREEPMRKHTTFRAGGPADYFVTPADEAGLIAAVCLCRREEVPYYILGNGSNLLVSEKGYQGVIIETGKALSGIKADGRLLTAGAGVLMSALAKEALRLSLEGLEAASGIPGTLGGAVVMNAGAYGFEIRDVLEQVRILEPDGTVRELPAAALKLGYRYSVIPEKEYIVLNASLRLKEGCPDKIRSKTEELAARRRERQPLEYPSAGSTFKRPEGHFAGKLIEDAGLKGFQVGGARVSEKHCGFVINQENATADDIMELCRKVQERVFKNSGVRLEMEVKCLGEF